MVLCMFFHIVQNVKKINKNRTDHYECVVLYMHQVDLVYAFFRLISASEGSSEEEGEDHPQ
jgi:heme/copper-type cytochrome/quinol oxidase subunit 3